MNTLTHHAEPIAIDVSDLADVAHRPRSQRIPTASSASFGPPATPARSLPAEVHDALVDFADSPHQSGALLLRGLPVGDLPPTPPTPTTPAAQGLGQRVHAADRRPPARPARRLRARARRRPRPEHRAHRGRARSTGLHLVEGAADVPHRGGVPPAPPALPAAAVPARRSCGAHHAVVDLRGAAATAGRRRRRAVPAAVPHCGRRELPRRARATCSARRCRCSPAIAGDRRWSSTPT